MIGLLELEALEIRSETHARPKDRGRKGVSSPFLVAGLYSTISRLYSTALRP